MDAAAPIEAGNPGTGFPLTVATWNVNSLGVRFGHLQDWADRARPDVVLLQETKCVDEKFPRLELEAKGWHVAFRGQKSYNGVAILSRRPLTDVVYELDGDGGEARYVEARLEGGPVVASVYVPMGQSTGSDRFPFKLAFLDALARRMQSLLDTDIPFLVGGDLNVAPEPADVCDPKAFEGEVLFHPEERKRFRRFLFQGLTDAFRAVNKDAGHYSWWDYRAGAWQRNLGLRIDHLLLSPHLADCLAAAGIDKTPRGLEKASDHTPVWCRLDWRPQPY